MMHDYQKLEDPDLQRRLEEELELLSGQDQTQQARRLHELSVYQIELEMQNRELREAQAEVEEVRDRYVHLYEFAPVGYVTLDRKGIVRQINKTATRLLNTTSNNMVGRPLTLFVAREDLKHYMRHVEHAFACCGHVVDEFRLQVPGREPVTVRADTFVSAGDDDECRMALIDVSEQKRAQATAREHREALLHAGRLSMLGELSSGIAHEISQPVGAIATYAEALRNMAGLEKVPVQEIVDVVGKIAAQSERAGVVLDRIRTFGRRDTHCQAHEDILDVIAEAIGLVDPALKAGGVVVSVRHRGTLLDPAIDRVQIIQVLVNLLQNANEAVSGVPPDERQIDIEVAVPDRSWVEVVVADKGVGIAAEVRDRLFMPFCTNRPEGLGLGLSLSSSIVQGHGGRLWAQDNIPRGAVFRFTLPVFHEEGSGP